MHKPVQVFLLYHHQCLSIDVIISASYQASVSGYLKLGIGRDEAVAAMKRSVQLVNEVKEIYPHVIVAASAGPYAAILSDGSEYVGYDNNVTDEFLAEFHRERLDILMSVQPSPDLIAFETFPSPREARVVIDVLRHHYPQIQAWISYSCRDECHTCDGSDIREAVLLANVCVDIIDSFKR